LIENILIGNGRGSGLWIVDKCKDPLPE